MQITGIKDVLFSDFAILPAPLLARYVNGDAPYISVAGTDVVQAGPFAAIGSIYMAGQSIFNHDGGDVSRAYLRDQSHETVAANQSSLHSYDNVTVTISAGADLGWLVMAGNSAATMTGGTLVWAVIGDNARATFNLAEAGSLSRLWFADADGKATIRGYNLTASTYSVSGKSADGTDFSIGMTFTPCGWSVGCSLADFDPYDFAGLELIDLGAQLEAGAVPDAPTCTMLVIGFGTVGTRIRRRRAVAASA